MNTHSSIVASLLASQRESATKLQELKTIRANLRSDPVLQDKVSLTELIWKLVAKVQQAKGDKGDRGLMGLQGPKGDSVAGPRGPMGPAGREGRAATVDPSAIRPIVESLLAQVEQKDEPIDPSLILPLIDRAIQSYDDARESEDPFLVGTKEVDESTLVDGGALTFDAKKNKLVYEKIKGKGRLGGGASFASLANHPYTFLTATSSFTATEGISLMDAAAGNIIVTLPLAAQGRTGRPFILKRIDSSANTISLALSGSDSLEGITTFQWVNQWQSLTVVPDGTSSYYIIAA